MNKHETILNLLSSFNDFVNIDKISILEKLSKNYPKLAKKFKKSTILFDDVLHFDDRDIQRILREVDEEVLVKALKYEDLSIVNKFLKNMSKRASMHLLDKIASSNINTEEKNNAIDEIIDIISELLEKDVIAMSD